MYVVPSTRRKTKPRIYLFHLVIKGPESRITEARCLVVDRRHLCNDTLDLVQYFEDRVDPLLLRSMASFNR